MADLNILANTQPQQNIVITGASKGIGSALAEEFAAAGYRLLLGARNEADLKNLADELTKKYPQSTVLVKSVDMSLKPQVLAFASWCLSFGPPDILINNAGQFIPGSIHEEADGLLEQMIATNLYSAYHLTRALVTKMIERKTGHIFNICSIASIQPYANGGSYSISKFAMLGFNHNLREELKPAGIKVTAVLPGAVYTASWSGTGVDPQRIMEATDIAKMVYASSQLSMQACVETIVLRPQLGDL